MANKTITQFTSGTLDSADELIYYDVSLATTNKTTINDVGLKFDNVAVPANGKIYFEGGGSDTYLMYNSTTQKVELYVNGVKKVAWG